MLIFFNIYLQREEGVNMVTKAICSGIFNDLGSGSNVDVCVITKVCMFFSLVMMIPCYGYHEIILLSAG